MNYNLKDRDLRFIKAVDYILTQHQKFGLEPRTESILSENVYGKRNVISKIRAAQRGVSLSQIERLANYFELDMNYFFKELIDLKYEPHAISRNISQRPDGNYIVSKGDNWGCMGNSQINIYLDKVKQYAESKSESLPNRIITILEAIKLESRDLEKRLQLKTQELIDVEKKLTATNQELVIQLTESKERENETLRRVLAFLEKSNIPVSEVLQNGVKPTPV